MKNEIKNYGFVPSVVTSEQYVLGAFNQLPKIIIQPDRNWKPFLPQWESQFDKFDPFGCTVFGTLNAIETYLRKLNTDRNYDYSERFNYILANITPPGADPHFVSEILRKFGVIEQAELPFTNTLEEFMLPKPMTEDKLNKGKEWGYVFQHEWLFTSYPGKDNMVNQIREALQYSPVCLSVTAWYEENGLYVDNGQPNGHWTLCYGIDDDGGLLIFDSYALVQNGVITNAFKKLHPDHKVLCAKRYSITKKIPIQEQLNIIERILMWISEQIALLQKKSIKQPLSEIVPLPPVITPPTTPQPQPEPVKLPSKYDWSTPEKSRHSVRVICDEEKLSVQDKNDLCATIGGESGWNAKAVGSLNFDGTRDYGLVQVNSKWWIGEGKQFPSIEYVLNNPEICCRWMCKQWKLGNKKWWIAFKSGAYLRYL